MFGSTHSLNWSKKRWIKSKRSRQARFIFNACISISLHPAILYWHILFAVLSYISTLLVSTRAFLWSNGTCDGHKMCEHKYERNSTAKSRVLSLWAPLSRVIWHKWASSKVILIYPLIQTRKTNVSLLCCPVGVTHWEKGWGGMCVGGVAPGYSWGWHICRISLRFDFGPCFVHVEGGMQGVSNRWNKGAVPAFRPRGQRCLSVLLGKGRWGSGCVRDENITHDGCVTQVGRSASERAA